MVFVEPQRKSYRCLCCTSTEDHLQPQRLQSGEALGKILVEESREEKRRARYQLRLSWSPDCSVWRIHPGKSCLAQGVLTAARQRHVDLQLEGAHSYCTYLTTGPCLLPLKI